MRIAWIVGVAVATGGCAQIIGADDPVAEFEVSDRIAGRFVLALDATSTGATLGVYRFLLDLEVYPDDRAIYAAWTALEQTGPGATDVVSYELGADLANQLELDFVFDGTIDIPAASTPDGLEHRLIGSFAGRFPALDGETATTDGFCGTGSGTVSLPSDAPFTATFAAVRLETGTDPPEATDADTACADL